MFPATNRVRAMAAPSYPARPGAVASVPDRRGGPALQGPATSGSTSTPGSTSKRCSASTEGNSTFRGCSSTASRSTRRGRSSLRSRSWLRTRPCTRSRSPTPFAKPSAGVTKSSRTSGAACRGVHCISAPSRWARSAEPVTSIRRGLTSRSRSSTERGAITSSRPPGWPRISAGLPAKLDHVDELAAHGIIGGEAPTAADLQIGSTLRVLLVVGDLRPLLTQRPAEAIARRWFPEYAGDIPVGAYPAGWVPVRDR